MTCHIHCKDTDVHAFSQHAGSGLKFVDVLPMLLGYGNWCCTLHRELVFHLQHSILQLHLQWKKYCNFIMNTAESWFSELKWDQDDLG